MKTSTLLIILWLLCIVAGSFTTNYLLKKQWQEDKKTEFTSPLFTQGSLNTRGTKPLVGTFSHVVVYGKSYRRIGITSKPVPHSPYYVDNLIDTYEIQHDTLKIWPHSTSNTNHTYAAILYMPVISSVTSYDTDIELSAPKSAALLLKMHGNSSLTLSVADTLPKVHIDATGIGGVWLGDATGLSKKAIIKTLTGKLGKSIRLVPTVQIADNRLIFMK